MTQIQTSAHQRVLFFDQIKAVMIALVVVVHVTLLFLPGGAFMGLSFAGRIQPGWLTGVDFAIVDLSNTFFMCMLFLISGYFVPRSVAKKGVADYLKSRLRRLGIPFLFGLLVINNLSYLVSQWFQTGLLRGIPLAGYPLNHLGVLWFLVVLFSFDLLYCGWVKIFGDCFRIDDTIPPPGLFPWLVSAGILAVIEVLMAMQGNFWLKLMNSPLDGLGAQGPHIFTYAFLFFLGCKSASHQWLERLDAHLVVKWFRLSIFLSLLLLGLCAVLAMNGHLKDEAIGVARLLAFMNTFIGWGVMGYLLLWFQRHQQSCGQWLATAGVDSFAVYIIHPLIVVVVMGLISLTEWPNFAALVLGGVASVLVSFGLSHQLRRVPLFARVI